jgi:hypothetical protein
MEARFRQDYAGEFVIIESRWTNGKKIEKREWIANPIENQHISGRATCIGNNIDQYLFDYTRLQRHRGGLLGSKKLQTYGTGTIAQQMRLDFAVETTRQGLATIIESNYQENNVVYTTPQNCIVYPGEFYLIPQTPNLIDIALLLYLAAFDGHKEIFLLGYHKETPIESQSWINQVRSVMDAYPGVLFYMVGESTIMPDMWMEANNGRNLTYREFISYCDVSQ